MEKNLYTLKLEIELNEKLLDVVNSKEEWEMLKAELTELRAAFKAKLAEMIVPACVLFNSIERGCEIQC